MKIIIILISLMANSVFAVRFKVGVLTPEGTNWSKNLKKMAKEVKKATDGKVKFKFYFGGSQGDESDVLRKIRIGQLQGGVFTGKTLGDIDGNTRLMELPFIFGSDRKKAWNVFLKMDSILTNIVEKKGFVSLGFFEIGMVHFASTKKVQNLKELQNLKIWSWAGDRVVETMIEEMNLQAVPLPLPDVLGALSTGIIEGAYAPPLGIMALQWNSKIKYILDLPLAYSIGAILIDQNKWNKIPKEMQVVVKKITKKYVGKINEANISDNKEALRLMKESGVTFVSFDKNDIKKVKTISSKLQKKLTGKLFTNDMVKKFNILNK